MNQGGAGIDISGRKLKPCVDGSHERLRYVPAAAISKDDILIANGKVGGHVRLTKADSDLPLTARGKLYLATHAIRSGDVGTDPNGYAATWGLITGVDTNSGTVGDLVYLSGTAGGWSLTAGTVPRVIGRIIVKDATDGVIEFDGTLDSMGLLIPVTVTIAAASASGTAAVGTAFNGKPVFAMINQAATDGTLTHLLRANIAAGTLTVVGNANATADVTVKCLIDAR